MIQSGGFYGELLVALPYAAFKEETQQLIKIALELTKYATKYIVNKGLDRLKKYFPISEGSGITLTNNEIKDIIKLIKSLENRRILLKGTIKKVISQERGFLNFFRPLMTAGLPLMKNVLTPFPKSILIPLRLSAGISAADVAIQKKISWIRLSFGYSSIDNFKSRNRRHNEIS